MSVEIDFRLEFVVHGTPASGQTKRLATRENWKQKVRDATKPALPVCAPVRQPYRGAWLDARDATVTRDEVAALAEVVRTL